MNRRTYLIAAAFVLTVIVANFATAQLGIVHWLGIAATAGTWFAGFGFVCRDSLQDAGGYRPVLAVIIIGAALSAAFSPRLALASCAAFLLSELADWAVYQPLHRSGRTRAAIASNIVGAVVDTFVFLTIAGFPVWVALPGQVLIKVGVTTLFVVIVRGISALLRQPVRS